MTTKYTKEILEDAVVNSTSLAGVLRILGRPQAGGTQAHISRLIKAFEIDTSHFLGKGHNLGQIALNRKSLEDILVVLPEGSYRPKVKQLRRAMLESGIPHLCSECKTGPVWNDKPLTLEVDHVDGNWLNNLLSNLRFLCPNCHSQEDTSNRSWKNK